MEENPNRDELVGTPPQRLSWAEFGRAVDATAAELARRGFGKDDLLVAQLPNIWELAMLYLAAATAGGLLSACLFYSSDAAVALLCGDLCGSRTLYNNHLTHITTDP